MPPKGKGDLARQKQEEEIMEYLKQEYVREFIYDWSRFECVIETMVKAIMRRYDLFDTEDMSRD